ncbi:MAG TPA: mandelate racemase/muconate lactonizing enzyme family protein [Lacipirellulaceae bacterium]|nr:mandelate racemase/muconate lactonizing enzyme family protein [Lacipirellulaceae bacterium]
MATEVVVPARAGTINSPGVDQPLHKLPVAGQESWTVQFDVLPKCVLEMHLSDGTVGFGELYRDHDWRIVESVARRLVGLELEKLPRQKLPIAHCREYDGFECAIWDAFAKLHDLPLAELLGGQVQEKVRVGAWSGHRTVGNIRPLAKQFVAAGYDCIKFKCDLADDVAEWCREIAECAPGMQVILDPNERWSTPADARQRIEQLRSIGNVLCLEDPIPRWMLAEYAELKAFSAIPIVLHVSLPYIYHGQRVHDAIRALQLSAVDGFNFNGGLVGFQQLDRIAAAAGLPCWHGSEIDLGILEAMYLHQCAAAPSCTWPSDIFGRLIREHDLLTVPLPLRPPFAMVPPGPGLGVELDPNAIWHYQTDMKEFRV